MALRVCWGPYGITITASRQSPPLCHHCFYSLSTSIVAPTYHRTESLPEFLDNYATGHIPSLKAILVIWNNEEDPPLSLNDTIAQYPVPVTLERRAKNSKNERFRRTSSITTAAVFALDDDMVITPRDVEYGFQAWRTFHQPRTRMVGYIRRRDQDGMYRMSPSPDGYSMVLTKSAFIHVDWMDLWWADTQVMRDFRDYVEARKSSDEVPKTANEHTFSQHAAFWCSCRS